MVTYIRYRIYTDTVTAFAKAAVKALSGLKAVFPCKSCDVSQCISEPENFILRIYWDADLEKNPWEFQTAEMNTFIQTLAPYQEFIIEMRNYDVAE